MIVAIVNQTSPTGQVVCEEFRDAASEADAVDDFVNEYTPPKNAADYLGYDSGWSSYQRPAAGMEWAYDFDSPGLVQVDASQQYVFKASSKMVNLPVAVIETTNWQDLGGVTTTPAFFVPDLTKAVGRAVGCAKTNGSGVQLRMVEIIAGVDTPISDPFDVPDGAGVAADFGFYTNTAPQSGRRVYKIQGRLQGATDAEIMFTSMTLLEKVA